jgi:uncharacterized protein YceK
MKKLFVLIIAVILVGCATSEQMKYPSSGEYVGTYSRDSVKVRWVRVPPSTIGDVCASKIDSAAKIDVFTGEESRPVGCAKPGWELNVGNTCTIYASIPKSEYGIEILGHEMLHCFIGDFHH